MKKTFHIATMGLSALMLLSLTSCEDILEQYFPKPTPPPTVPAFPSLGLDISFYALSEGTKLDGYSTKDPATRLSSVTIAGLQSGERILAMDFRPATGQLYGLSSANRLYIINQLTGRTQIIGSAAISPALAGALVGFDFNPTVDRIRIVTSTGQNLRVNPETGAGTVVDGVLNGAPGVTIAASAYTDNVAGATTTTLYNLDPATDKLYRQNPPNDGTLEAVGQLNLDITGDGGFDIDAKSGTALGLFAVLGKPTLFTVNLTTGVAQPLAQYAQTLGYTSLAIPTQPVAYAANSGYIDPADITNFLLIFNPTTQSRGVLRGISGLAGNETVVGLDFRPATGQLYALVRGQGGVLPSTSRLYTINPASGQATRVADLSVPLGNAAFGFDFNPVADRIRIVGTNGQNLRVNPTDGVAIADGRLSLGVQAAAYDNNFPGSTSTNLYVISLGDAGKKLYQQSPPNEGTLTEIADISEFVGQFDIGGTTNTAYGFASRPGSDGVNVFTINLTTGALTPLGSSTFFSGAVPFAATIGLGF